LDLTLLGENRHPRSELGLKLERLGVAAFPIPPVITRTPADEYDLRIAVEDTVDALETKSDGFAFARPFHTTTDTLPDHATSSRRVIHTLAVDLLNALPVHEYELAGAHDDGLQDFWFDERKLPEYVPDPRRIGGPIDRPTVSEVARLYNLHGNQKRSFFHVTVRILYSLSKKYDFQDTDQSSLDARFMTLVPEDDPQLRGLITGQGSSGETAIVDAVVEFLIAGTC
jgi:hypothetical protein